MKRPVAAVLRRCSAPARAAAQTVSMGGSLGNNALLVIDGKPRTVAVGATVDGVRLVSVTGNEAMVEVKGKRVLAAPRRRAGQPRRQGERRRRQADRPDRRKAAATSTPTARSTARASASSSTPARPSCRWPGTRPSASASTTRTAGAASAGRPTARSPVYARQARRRCASATSRSTTSTRSSLPAPMPYILLGNSFLTRFQMKRENDVMTLDLRY